MDAKRAERLARMRARNAWGNVNPHVPDGRIPRELTMKVRVRAMRNGGDPGDVQAIKQAMLEIGWEEPELQRSYFHPDYFCRLAGVWAGNYRIMKDCFREKVRQAFLREQQLEAVDLSQFESRPPSND